MKYRLSLFILIMLLIAMTLPAKAVFVEGLEDIPIPEGLHQVDNGNLNFGNEEIRFIEVYLTSKHLNFNKISAFYKETLPQMGWKNKKESSDRVIFERDGESLEIARESGDPLIIRLTVKSKL